MKVENIIPELNNQNPEYINVVQNKYNEFKRVSEVPPIYLESYIETNNLPNRLNILFNNIYDIITERYSYIFMFQNYDWTPHLSNTLIDEYFKYCINNDKLLEKVIYIDTKCLTDDFSKLINKSDVQPALMYSKETIYQNVETAPMVIWDGFTKIENTFELNRMYNILLSRYKRGLGNLFFIEKDISSMQQFDERFKNVINAAAILDCRNELVKLKPVSEEGYTHDR